MPWIVTSISSAGNCMEEHCLQNKCLLLHYQLHYIACSFLTYPSLRNQLAIQLRETPVYHKPNLKQ